MSESRSIYQTSIGYFVSKGLNNELQDQHQSPCSSPKYFLSTKNRRWNSIVSTIELGDKAVYFKCRNANLDVWKSRYHSWKPFGDDVHHICDSRFLLTKLSHFMYVYQLAAGVLEITWRCACENNHSARPAFLFEKIPSIWLINTPHMQTVHAVL